MDKTARFLRLPVQEQVLLAEAACLVAVFRITLWFVPFSRTRSFVRRIAADASSGRRNDMDRIAWAVETAGRGIPASSCLANALAAHVLLSRSGHGSEIKVGVARDEDGRFVAHAWVESGGRVLVGGAEREMYQIASGAARIV